MNLLTFFRFLLRPSLYLTLLLCAALALFVKPSQASTNISFNFPRVYDSGVNPSVALSSTGAVEVHETQSAVSAGMYYHVGTLQGGRWNVGASQEYDSGVTPSVAINDDGVVVETHKSQSNAGLYYHVGTVDFGAQTINFGNSQEYDSGITPSVAINNSGAVVEVHETQSSFSSGMYYHVGTVNAGNQTISFGGSQEYDSGVTPSVAINNNGVVVEVHKTQSPVSSNLYYHVGTVNVGTQTINFGGSQTYDSGVDPMVALTDNGYVIETHKSQSFDTLYQRIGIVDVNAKKINWLYSQSRELYAGENPYVAVHAANGYNRGILVNGSSVNSLEYSVSIIQDRSNWMHNNLSLLGNQTLSSIVIPGSHDSDTYNLNNCTTAVGVGANECNTQTQTLSILGQLQNGSRYFDIRPVYFNGDFVTGHFSCNSTLGLLGCNGPKVSDILDEVTTFMQESKDLVILDFSHFFDRTTVSCIRTTLTSFTDTQLQDLESSKTLTLKPFTNTQLQDLESSVSQQLGDLLYSGPQPSSTSKLNSLISQDKGAVLVLFDSPAGSTTGIYPSSALNIYNQYSNTNDLDAMVADQLNKLKNDSFPDNEFVLSWTLTLSNEQSEACAVGGLTTSILDLANTAETVLWSNMVSALGQQIKSQTTPNVVYIDNYQGFAADIAVWLNQQLMTSGFTKSCSNSNLQNTSVLQSTCQGPSSSSTTPVDLNSYIGNNNGTLTWQYGGFQKSCQNITLASPNTLSAQCQNAAQTTYIPTTIDLDERIINRDGHLKYVGS